MEKIKLDLIPSGKMPSLHASQYDDGREHGIDLFENGVVYKLDGTETLTINERKGDDCICSLDIENTFADSNHIVFASTEQMCAVWGNNICELVIAKGEKTIGTLNFILEIEPSPTEGGIESESEIKNLERQIEAITEEVIGEDYYTAEQTDNAIATAIEGKADTTYVNEELAKKADKTDTYTKSQVDTALNGKADKDVVEDIADNYAVKAVYDEEESQNTDYPPQLTDGYVGTNGVVQPATTLQYTAKIPVNDGDKVTALSTSVVNMRFVCAYLDNVVQTSKGASGSIAEYVVPEGVNYLVITVYKSHSVNAIRVTTSTTTQITKYYALEQALGYVIWKGNIENNTKITMLSSNVRFNVLWSFTGRVTQLGKLKIGINFGNTLESLCEVDATNVYYRSNPSGVIASKPHGLTISDDLRILVFSNYQVNRLGFIKIFSGESSFTLDVTSYNTEAKGEPCLLSENAVLTDCSFAWIPQDINKPIWVFGDSWATMFEGRWVYYMQTNGFNTNWLLNSFAGEKTEEGMKSLKNLLKLRKPEYIVWLYGMNNGDTQDAVNEAWEKAYEELIDICDTFKITPILYTVPNTPTIKHTYKNQIVRNSGYRFIDCEVAMGSDQQGNWITGYQSADGNHTTQAGAIALYNRILSDFPEIAGSYNLELPDMTQYYKKPETNSLLYAKADKVTTYTKEQVDDIVYNILPDDTASGSVANFTTSLELPIKSLDVDVNAVQEAGTPTPASPLPISGWSEIKNARTGKNLLDESERTTLVNNIRYYVINGVLLKAGTYTLSISEQVSGLYVKEFIINDTLFVKYNSTFLTFSLAKDTRVWIDLYKTGINTNDTVQLEVGSSASTYEPFNGTSEVINLGDTYYGGHLTQDKAGHRQFEVTHDVTTFGDNTWGSSTWGSDVAYSTTLTTAKSNNITSMLAGLKCETYSEVTPSNMYSSNADAICLNGKVVRVRDSNFATKAEWETAMQNYKIVYPIETPYVIDLPDGEPIITLNGTNNIYADTGDCAVEYKCSVAEYVANHSGGGGAKSLGGVFLGGSNSGSEEETTEESEEAEKTKEIDEPKEEIKTIGDEPISKK